MKTGQVTSIFCTFWQHLPRGMCGNFYRNSDIIFTVYHFSRCEMVELSSTALTYIVCQPSIRFKTPQRCSTAKRQFLQATYQKWLHRFFCINRDNVASLQRYTCTQFYILYIGCYLLWVRFSHQKSIIMHVSNEVCSHLPIHAALVFQTRAFT